MLKESSPSILDWEISIKSKMKISYMKDQERDDNVTASDNSE